MTDALRSFLASGIDLETDKDKPVSNKPTLKISAPQKYILPDMPIKVGNNAAGIKSSEKILICVNVLRPSIDLYRNQREIVYSAAHLAFLYLVQANSEDSIKQLLDKMHSGENFEVAFEDTFEESPPQFEDSLQAILREAAAQGVQL